jgi:hypothetical protein
MEAMQAKPGSSPSRSKSSRSTFEPSLKSRVQRAVNIYFAMAVNNSQGQSLQTGGMDLQIPEFSYGQRLDICG